MGSDYSDGSIIGMHSLSAINCCGLYLAALERKDYKLRFVLDLIAISGNVWQLISKRVDDLAVQKT